MPEAELLRKFTYLYCNDFVRTVKTILGVQKLFKTRLGQCGYFEFTGFVKV
jgi:hypothetical protein